MVPLLHVGVVGEWDPLAAREEEEEEEEEQHPHLLLQRHPGAVPILTRKTIFIL